MAETTEETRVNGMTLVEAQEACLENLRSRAERLLAEGPERTERVRLMFDAVARLRTACIPCSPSETTVYVHCTVADLQRVRKALGPMKLRWRDVGEDGKLSVSLEPTGNPSVLITYQTEVKPGARCKIVERTHKVLVCDR